MSITIYRASAGSGKTYALTRAFVRRLLAQERPTGYLHQLALTFTRKATEEMKMRILKLLSELSLPVDDERGVRIRREFCGEPECAGMSEEEVRRRAVALRSAVLHDYGRFSVYTIDAFFQRIVRSFLWEAGLPPAYTVELDSQRILQEAIDYVVDEVATHAQNRKWIGDILSERIQEGKRWNVQEAFAEVGKQVLDERFRSFGQPFVNQLCDKEFLTSYMRELRDFEFRFRKQMEQYAQDVLDFLDSKGLSTSDFKGKSRSFMRYFDKVKEGAYTPTDAVRSALDDSSLWTAKNDTKAPLIESLFEPLSKRLQTVIDYYDAQAPVWFAVRLAMQSLPQMGLAADIQRHVNALLSNDNAVHLSQTLMLLHTLISNSDAPFILERMGCRYSDFLLDEFQDTSVMQWKVLLPLIHNGLAQGGVSLAVGDVKQSIYRWRNSDRRILGGGVQNDLSPYHPKDESLTTNWRSREVLVETVGNLLEHLTETLYQHFLATLPQNASPECQNIPQEITKVYADVHQQTAPVMKDSGGYVAAYAVGPSEAQSARARVLEQLPHLIIEVQKRGFSASDICILVRKNDEGQQIASTLMAFKETPQAEGFCFDVVSPDTLFLARSPEVQLIVAIFKRFVYPDDALNNYLIQQLCGQLHTVCPDTLWSGALPTCALPEAFEELIRVLGWTERRACFPFLQELHHQILTFSKNQAADTFSFVRWWNQQGEKVTLKLERSGEAIEILTIHKAKGLEYPVVVIPFCDWGLDYKATQAPILWTMPQQAPLNRLPHVPMRYGSELMQSECAYDYFYEKMQYRVDQMNLFYVAATRAEDELHLFLPQPARTSYSLASILMNELFPQEAGSDAGNNTGDGCRTFGAPVIPINPAAPLSAPSDTSLPLSKYASASHALRLHTRLADESPVAEEISPRKRGIILHQLLSRIRTCDDIEQAIQELINEGVVSPDSEEQTYYREIVRNAVSQPQAAIWFDGSWNVLNEPSILLPAAQGQTVRPDRVMEKDGHVVVIDYKFGKPQPAHQRQIDEYVQIIKQMGYRQVEGHVWYIPS